MDFKCLYRVRGLDREEMGRVCFREIRFLVFIEFLGVVGKGLERFEEGKVFLGILWCYYVFCVF